MKLLFAAAEIIRNRDLGEKRFFNNLNHVYHEYIKDIPNEPKPTLEQFDDYLYRWAEKVWPRALAIIRECSRNKYVSNSSFKVCFPGSTSTLIFGWKWKLSRRMFIDVVSTLTKQRWNNNDRITSIQRRWPSVVLTLIAVLKFESTYVHRHCFDIEKTALGGLRT